MSDVPGRWQEIPGRPVRSCARATRKSFPPAPLTLRPHYSSRRPADPVYRPVCRYVELLQLITHDAYRFNPLCSFCNTTFAHYFFHSLATYQRSRITFLIYLWVEYRYEVIAVVTSPPAYLYVCLSVCLSVYVSARISHQMFCTCYLWPWLGPPLTVMHVLPVLWMTSCFHIME